MFKKVAYKNLKKKLLTYQFNFLNYKESVYMTKSDFFKNKLMELFDESKKNLKNRNKLIALFSSKTNSYTFYHNRLLQNPKFNEIKDIFKKNSEIYTN